jgi:hypothetical protein
MGGFSPLDSSGRTIAVGGEEPLSCRHDASDHSAFVFRGHFSYNELLRASHQPLTFPKNHSLRRRFQSIGGSLPAGTDLP